MTLARLEVRQWSGAVHPSLWLRGFLSSRHYLYPGIHDRSSTYISDVAVEARLGRINPPRARALVAEKAAFADLLRDRGRSHQAPLTYGVVRQGRFEGSEESRRLLPTLPEVVVKPTRGRGGRGIRIVPGADAVAAWTAESGDLLVQERIRPHRYAHAIHPGSLNTIRVVTVRPPEGDPIVAGAAHRFGTASTGVVDNASAGGLVSGIALDSGRLTAAVGRPRGRRRVEHATHPDSGARIEGVEVPHWQDVLALTVDLMSAVPDALHVGWDVCVSERGPLVIEGNGGTANLNVLQYHGPFVTDPRVRAFYERHRLLRP